MSRSCWEKVAVDAQLTRDAVEESRQVKELGLEPPPNSVKVSEWCLKLAPLGPSWNVLGSGELGWSQTHWGFPCGHESSHMNPHMRRNSPPQLIRGVGGGFCFRLFTTKSRAHNPRSSNSNSNSSSSKSPTRSAYPLTSSCDTNESIFCRTPLATS